jgi:hypothetical protein
LLALAIASRSVVEEEATRHSTSSVLGTLPARRVANHLQPRDHAVVEMGAHSVIVRGCTEEGRDLARKGREAAADAL